MFFLRIYLWCKTLSHTSVLLPTISASEIVAGNGCSPGPSALFPLCAPKILDLFRQYHISSLLLVSHDQIWLFSEEDLLALEAGAVVQFLVAVRLLQAAVRLPVCDVITSGGVLVLLQSADALVVGASDVIVVASVVAELDDESRLLIGR